MCFYIDSKFEKADNFTLLWSFRVQLLATIFFPSSTLLNILGPQLILLSHHT